jgi:threonine dehydrogenase-like Zn-dependent dehydrogenase
MEVGCLLEYTGDAFFKAALAEPISCIIGAFHASYHTTYGSYVHAMGIRQGGRTALLGAAGPMGLGAVECALNCDRKPSLLVVTDIDEGRLDRAAALRSPGEARKKGVELHYVNTAKVSDAGAHLRSLTGGLGFDDVFIFAPVRSVVETGDRILAMDGCANFFAGPSDQAFSASVNFYNVHYGSTHLAATSGGNKDDMVEALKLLSDGRIDPAMMVTHVGGLNAVIETTLNLPGIPGGKKLIYTGIDMPLTAIADFREKGKTERLFADLAEITGRNNGLWSLEAEKRLLAGAGAA